MTLRSNELVDPPVPFHQHRNTAHWTFTILAILVAVGAVIAAFNMGKRITQLEQQLPAKADTAMVISRFNLVDGNRQQAQLQLSSQINALHDTLVVVRDSVETVDVKTDENFRNLMGIRKYVGLTK